MASTKPSGDKPSACDTDDGGASTAKRGRCPICGAPTEPGVRPFCSRRCADVDLSRWLRGGYAIPGRVETDEDGDDSIAAGEAGRPQKGAGEDEDDPAA